MSIFDLLNSDKSYKDIVSILKNEYKLYTRTEQGSNLTLVKYNRDNTDMSVDFVRQFRGLVFRNSDLKILCFPPEKSFISDEFLRVVGDDWVNVRCEEYEDGTMINVYYDDNSSQWIISTRSRIGAKCSWLCDETFDTLFRDASQDMDLNMLDKTVCYTFVLGHPKTRIVVKHKRPFVCLVSARRVGDSNYEDVPLEEIRDNLLEKNINVKLPKIYNFASFEEVKDYVSKQSAMSQGIMLKYKNIRTKLRNKEYNYIKSLKGNTPYLINLYLELRKARNVSNYLKYFPEHKALFNNFREDIHQITYRIYNWYVNVHIKKYFDKEAIPYQYKPHCQKLHNNFKDSVRRNQKKRVSLNTVISYVNQLPIYSLIFIRNYYIEENSNITR